MITFQNNALTIKGNLNHETVVGALKQSVALLSDNKLINMPKPASVLVYPRIEKQRIFLLEQNNVEISSF